MRSRIVAHYLMNMRGNRDSTRFGRRIGTLYHSRIYCRRRQGSLVLADLHAYTSFVLSYQGMESIKSQFQGIRRALQRAYPEVEFTRWRDGKRNTWAHFLTNAHTAKPKWSKEMCREFFRLYAAEKGFDPLDPTAWYRTDLADMKKKRVLILSFRVNCLLPHGQGGETIQRQYRGWKKALQVAFSEVNFAKWLSQQGRLDGT